MMYILTCLWCSFFVLCRGSWLAFTLKKKVFFCCPFSHRQLWSLICHYPPESITRNFYQPADQFVMHRVNFSWFFPVCETKKPQKACERIYLSELEVNLSIGRVVECFSFKAYNYLVFTSFFFLFLKVKSCLRRNERNNEFQKEARGVKKRNSLIELQWWRRKKRKEKKKFRRADDFLFKGVVNSFKKGKLILLKVTKSSFMMRTLRALFSPSLFLSFFQCLALTFIGWRRQVDDKKFVKN